MKEKPGNPLSCARITAALMIITPCAALAAPVSIEVQENIDTLIKTNRCVDCKLSGADLNRLDLSGADLQGADLTGATFFLTDLSGADLTGAILRGVQFGGADLADADLSGADLRGASLAGAYLAGAKMDGSFADLSISDDTELREITERVYVPAESAAATAPENPQVAIGERRDFAAVPPVIDRAATDAGGGQPAGPAALAGGHEAPPVKRVTPVGHLTIDTHNGAAGGEQAASVGSAEREPESRERGGAESVATSVESEIADGGETKDQVDEKISPAAGMVETGAETPAPTVMAARTAGDGAGAAASMAPAGTEADPTDQAVEPVREPGPQLQEVAIVQAERTGATGPDSPMVPAENPSEPVAQSAGKKQELSAEPEPEPAVQAARRQLLDTGKCFGCDLAGADLAGANLDGADLESADLSGATLAGADLAKANLKGASLRAANLREADLRKADLYKADFSGADCTGADLTGALTDETDFTGAVGLEAAP